MERGFARLECAPEQPGIGDGRPFDAEQLLHQRRYNDADTNVYVLDLTGKGTLTEVYAAGLRPRRWDSSLADECFVEDKVPDVQNRRRQGGGDLCVILCFQGVSGWQAEFGTGPEPGSAHRGRTRMDVANRQDIEQFDRTVGCVSRDGWHR